MRVPMPLLEAETEAIPAEKATKDLVKTRSTWPSMTERDYSSQGGHSTQANPQASGAVGFRFRMLITSRCSKWGGRSSADLLSPGACSDVPNRAFEIRILNAHVLADLGLPIQ